MDKTLIPTEYQIQTREGEGGWRLIGTPGMYGRDDEGKVLKYASELSETFPRRTFRVVKIQAETVAQFDKVIDIERI